MLFVHKFGISNQSRAEIRTKQMLALVQPGLGPLPGHEATGKTTGEQIAASRRFPIIIGRCKYRLPEI